MIDLLANLLPFITETNSLELSFRKTEVGDYLLEAKLVSSISLPEEMEEEEDEIEVERYLDGSPIG